MVSLSTNSLKIVHSLIKICQFIKNTLNHRNNSFIFITLHLFYICKGPLELWVSLKVNVFNDGRVWLWGDSSPVSNRVWATNAKFHPLVHCAGIVSEYEFLAVPHGCPQERRFVCSVPPSVPVQEDNRPGANPGHWGSVGAAGGGGSVFAGQPTISVNKYVVINNNYYNINGIGKVNGSNENEKHINVKDSGTNYEELVYYELSEK